MDLLGSQSEKVTLAIGGTELANLVSSVAFKTLPFFSRRLVYVNFMALFTRFSL